jgi:hypothetical protein
MTTRAEIKKWVKPFVASRQDVVSLPRAVVLAPIHHVSRGVYFRSRSSKTWPEIAWFFELLFAPPGSRNLDFDGRLHLGETTDAGFLGRLDQAMRESFDTYVTPIDSIEKFHDFAIGPERRFTFLNLDDYGLEHGTVLAALGRLAEAEVILTSTTVEAENWAAIEQRAEEELRRAKPRPRGVFVGHGGRDRLKIVEVVRELLSHVRARDRAAIGALLREWEYARVRRREIEHLWEPTPFPVEMAV